MANFNERMVNESNKFRETIPLEERAKYGLVNEARLTPIAPEDKGTPKDWAEMEAEGRRIDQKNNQPIGSNYGKKACID